MTTNRMIAGDAHRELAKLDAASVDCVITSPPYFRLRNYAHDQQIGLEQTVEEWVDNLRAVFSEVARVLKPTGSVWVNLGDSYSRHQRAGASPKGLLLAPERLLLALAADGWLVRNKVIWAKTNPMPASVTDRLATTHEYVYFLTRERHYYFDLDAIRVPHQSRAAERAAASSDIYPPARAAAPRWAGPLAGNNAGLAKLKRSGRVGHPLGKNPGDVWKLATANFHGAHFATFPEHLVERPLLATCPAKTCTRCGQPWQHQPARTLGHLAVVGELEPTCTCGSPGQPGLVLDPFFGAGTVALVAEAHDRRWLGIEINDDYRRLAEQRLQRARISRKQPARTRRRKDAA